ncbi:MAG: hypothetical protein E2O72_08725 [Candidatus Dadabacteria bacterium]|nr:MAG: hypothetical protein E2O72_08725 [Candidatus Dadabacteria bacterium]
MRLAIIIGIFTGILTLLIFAEHLIDDSEEPSYLFVLSVTSGSLKGDTLILNGVPNVIYFSDHMSRKVGHMSLSNFVEKWDKGVDSFKADPPNATLSVLMKNGERNVEVELLSAEYKNGSLFFKIVEVESNATDSFEASSVFIHFYSNPTVLDWLQ